MIMISSSQVQHFSYCLIYTPAPTRKLKELHTPKLVCRPFDLIKPYSAGDSNPKPKTTDIKQAPFVPQLCYPIPQPNMTHSTTHV